MYGYGILGSPRCFSAHLPLSTLVSGTFCRKPVIVRIRTEYCQLVAALPLLRLWRPIIRAGVCCKYFPNLEADEETRKGDPWWVMNVSTKYVSMPGLACVKVVDSYWPRPTAAGRVCMAKVCWPRRSSDGRATHIDRERLPSAARHECEGNGSHRRPRHRLISSSTGRRDRDSRSLRWGQKQRKRSDSAMSLLCLHSPASGCIFIEDRTSHDAPRSRLLAALVRLLRDETAESRAQKFPPFPPPSYVQRTAKDALPGQGLLKLDVGLDGSSHAPTRGSTLHSRSDLPQRVARRRN